MIPKNPLSRRNFMSLAGATGAVVMAGCSKPDQPKTDIITPVEILARHHGAIYRAVAVLEEIRGGMNARMDLPPEMIGGTVEIIRTFVMDIHQQMEEKYIFPVFDAQGKMSGLVGVLREQHAAGARLIEILRGLCDGFSAKDLEKRRTMASAIHLLSRMCRAHAEWEDTALFPLLRSIVPPKSFAELSSVLYRTESELLGQNGFDEIIRKLNGYENILGIGDLASYTPRAEDLS